MTDAPLRDAPAGPAALSEKFTDPDQTADGQTRAQIALVRLETLWINTGTLCNIECANCYIESSPRNDRLAYFTSKDLNVLLDEIERTGQETRLIGFTGGEPFMNPEMPAMARAALARGFEVLILTNAMQPLQRPRIKAELIKLKQQYGARLGLRVSLDHFSKALHECERGPGTWDVTIAGIDWLAEQEFRISLAGRTSWNETETAPRKDYAGLIADRGYRLDAFDPADLLLLPEMDGNLDVPEITTRCWDLLGVDPAGIMCATSRMVVKYKGADETSVVPCTLLPYDVAFRMGTTLTEASAADGGVFDNGRVKLNHRNCSKFCVLGGGSCTAAGGE
jgi:hypothetical protein